MARFRKKPVVVEAVQFSAETLNAVQEFTGESCLLYRKPTFHLLVPTLEGTMRAEEGDWIIRGVKGEFYPCKPDIFEQTYESAEDE